MSDKMFGLIPAAGKGLRFGEISKRYPKCLLPYKGLPIIVHTIRAMLGLGIEEIYVVVNYGEDRIREMLEFYELEKLVKFVHYDADDGPGGSVRAGMLEAGGTGRCLMVLSDIFMTESAISFLRERPFSDVLGFEYVDDYERWCLLDAKSKKLIDKPKTAPENSLGGRYLALNGIYQISDVAGFLDQDVLVKTAGELQISSFLGPYIEERDIIALPMKVIDFGTREEYLLNRDVSNSREFNEVKIHKNLVSKRSEKNPEKIYREACWLQNIPAELAHFVPRVFVNNLDSYVMERIDLPTLRDTFIFLNNDVAYWEKIIDGCLGIVEEFSDYGNVNSTKFLKTVHDKTFDRVYWTDGFEAEFMVELEKVLNSRYRRDTLYHGDLCFSNMFYDENSDRFRLIDPRGEMFGSALYDLAKLYHSFVGMYDLVDSHMYICKNTKDSVSLKMYTKGKGKIAKLFQEKLSAYLDDEDYKAVQMIAASLFLSMIPLHTHCKTNQAAYLYIHRWMWNNIKNGTKILEIPDDWTFDITGELNEIQEGFEDSR